jgi:hypothetical protein
MALAVLFVGRGLVSAAQWQRLVLEVGFGAVCYAGLLLAFSPTAVSELAGLVQRRRQGLPAANA